MEGGAAIDLSRRRHVHFLGICGYAVSGAALTVQGMGHRVTGSDDNAYPPTTTILTEAGIHWMNRSDPANIDRNGTPDLVVVGNQTRPNNPELLHVQALHLPVCSEPELWELLTRDRLRLTVTGTHGKTTTASLLAWILHSAGLDPGWRLGATTRDLGTSAALGSTLAAAPFVFEGDEYTTAPWDRRPKFLLTHPRAAAVTVLEHDHPDVYPTLEDYLRPFDQLVDGMPDDGLLVLNADDPACMRLAERARCPVQTFGRDAGTLHVDGATVQEQGSDGTVRQRFPVVDLRPGATERYDVTLSLPGAHNRMNALAAILLAAEGGASVEACLSACASFLGPTRRFEVKGKYGGITVVDDYGHHPAEVAAVVRAAVERHPGQRLIVVNVPHTYSRTLAMLEDYTRCYRGADLVLVGPIEAARERGQTATVSNADVAARARTSVPRAGTVASAQEAVDAVVSEARAGDVVLCVALGGFDGFAERLAAALRERYGD